MKLIRTVLLSIVVISILFSANYSINGIVSDFDTGIGLDEVLLKVFTPDSVLQNSVLSYHGNYNLTVTLVANDPLDTPNEFNISAYPNPVNPTTTILFQIIKPGKYNIDCFDLWAEN